MPNNHPNKQNSQALGLNGLTDDELGDIHQATLEVLAQTGVFIEADEALEVFDGAGAEIDRRHKIVKIPPQLVEDAIQSAPSTILLAGRDPKHDKELGTGRVHFTNFSEGIEVVDPFNGVRRAPLKADLANAAKLVDYLDESMSVRRPWDPVMCPRRYCRFIMRKPCSPIRPNIAVSDPQAGFC